MDISEFQSKIDSIKAYVADHQGQRFFVTSSFQTHSLPLLHILSEIFEPGTLSVYMTNTGFLFPETLEFADEICARFNLKLVKLNPDQPKVLQKDQQGNFLYASDPDLCCTINKTQPLNQVLASHDIWINGVRADQSSFRKALKVEERSKFGCTRYHPMLDWTSRDIYYYRQLFDIPEHPLDKEGYQSIGCEPCTTCVKYGGDERDSRWFGLNKTECGINTDLIVKESA